MGDWTRRDFVRTTTMSGLAASAAPPFHVRTRTADDPLGIRDQFPVTQELAYLNTASMGPVPLPVRAAMDAYAEERMMYRNPASRPVARARARTRFADLFGADPEEIAFLFSTSDGENLVANAIEWRPGDNVVVDELHFTTAFVVFRELERRTGIELRIVRPTDGRITVDDFAQQTDARTRLITVAWVSNRNGFRHDLPALSDLAHRHGAYLFADAIQAFGTFPTDLHAEDVDFACGNGYKWLFADYGCAPFYVKREHLEWMRPDRFGHVQVRGARDSHRYDLATDAAKFEYANPSYPSITALDASLAFLGEVGLEAIADHTQALAAGLRTSLADLGLEMFTPAGNPSPIVSAYHGQDPQTLADALMAEGVRFSFQEQGRLLRCAVAMFNNQDDVDRLLGVLRGMV